MSLQLAHERNGLLLRHAHSSTCTDRSRIARALQKSNADLSKAQACGHCNQLTARLTESLLHHLLFAKGQLPEPVSLLRKRRETAARGDSTLSRKRSRSNSTRARKEDKLLRKLDELRLHLEQAATHLAAFADNHGEGPSRRPYSAPLSTITSKDVRLLVVMGSSATMPREVFVLDLIQAVARCGSSEEAVQDLIEAGASATSEQLDQDMQAEGVDLPTETSKHHRDASRTKTSNVWERKLVRLLVSDERLEPFLGKQLAPTKLHLFLSAPTSFRCPGWSARHHLDFDLDALCQSSPADDMDIPPASADSSMSSPKSRSLKRPPSSPLTSQDRRWAKSTCESSSSVADSWPEDSASDHLGESSMSSVSDDSRPPSVADKMWPMSGGAAILTDGWLPRCSSPLAVGLQLQPSQAVQHVEASRTESSLGSSTVYGYESQDVAVDSSQEVERGNDGAPGTTAGGVEFGVRRRSREPKAGGLLSRNLLKGRGSRQASCAGSDSSSVRSVASSLKRTPGCAGLQIDFTDPEQAITATLASPGSGPHARVQQQSGPDWCWFQCEAVLEGFR